MAVTEKNILNRLYFIAGCMFIFSLAVIFKLFSIQFVQGEKYRGLAEKRTVKEIVIPANRGNVYDSEGSLLATSIPKYDIRIDALTPSAKTFEKHLNALSDSLSNYSGKPSSYYKKNIRRARANKNRYYLLARNIGYSDYIRIRNFPLLNLGAFKGGLIVEQKTKREYPMGAIAQRSIGYERWDDDGNLTRAGLDGAFGEKYLRGTDGKRVKQKIGQGQWKPISDANEVEPKDGYDIHTTLDVNIQDIAHHALLEQLEFYEADHGCAVVMEVKTGEIKAISNLGRTSSGSYYEKRNYAVWESHEPGSMFKLMSLAVALEDKVIDTSDVVDTENGILSFYGKKVRDSKRGGYGKISVAKAFEVSSNTAIVKVVDQNYKNNPKKFIDGLYKMNLQDQLSLPILGEGNPEIPDPRIKNGKWSGIALQWMAYGYGVKLTPLQTLTFYNAIANNGEMLKPRFLRQVKEFEKTVESFDKEIINKKICSDETVGKLQKLLKNVVDKEHGTGHKMYSSNFSMAGKTGTAQAEYWMKDWEENRRYISSFAGYFPAESPKYSCIVVIHKPSYKKGYYGADVSGPVFKKIAQKIYTDTPLIDEIKTLQVLNSSSEKEYQKYFDLSKTYKTIMPDLRGLPLMDAITLLENMDVNIKVETIGNGEVVKQSVQKNIKLKNNQTVILEAA